MSEFVQSLLLRPESH